MKRTLFICIVSFLAATPMFAPVCLESAGENNAQYSATETEVPSEMKNWDGPEREMNVDAGYSKIDPNLLGLVESTTDAAMYSSSPSAPVITKETEALAHIQVLAESVDLEAVESIILSWGGGISGIGTHGFGQDLLPSGVRVVQAWVPVQALGDLASSDEALYVRAPLKALMLKETPDTELPSSFDPKAWHAAGFRGSGVKIGVIDSGFATSSNAATKVSATEIRNFVDGKSGEPCNGGCRGT